MVADTGGGKVYLLYDATENEERVHDFGLIVLGVGAICVVGAYALSRRVAAVAAGPLLDLTDRLSTWAPGSPDLAVTRDDEAGRLIEAFNRMQNQVDRSIAREREFAGNLSHEVRTPLAAIRSDSELMLLTQVLTPDQRQRLARIVDNVDDVVVCLESARAMARDQLRPPEPVDLAQCMADAWRGHEAQADLADLWLDNRIPEGHVLILDRYALLTVLRNLVRNAIEHAAPATLMASLTGDGALALRDDGKGIDEADLPFLFRRYFSGRLRDAGGLGRDETAHGLGLAIAKRVCDMQGWTLTVESSRMGPARGTCFLLRFRTNRHGCDADFTILRLWPVYTAPLSLTCALPQFCHAHSSHARAARAVQTAYLLTHVLGVPALLACLAWWINASGLDMTIARTLFDPAIDDFPCIPRAGWSLSATAWCWPCPSAWAWARWAWRWSPPGCRPGSRRAGRPGRGGDLPAGPAGGEPAQALHDTAAPLRPGDAGRLYAVSAALVDLGASPGGRCIAQRARRRGLCHAEPVFRRLGDGAAGRWGGLALGLGAGLGFSAVRVLQGAHFLSQTVWSAALLWFLGRWCSIR